jgi:hypothetical protein
MNASRFDAWTRRRFGLVAGGLTASLLGLIEPEVAEARKCKDLRQKCGKNKPCCKKKNLKCREVLDDPDNKRCCRPVQGKCAEANECCGDFICDDIAGQVGTRCCGAEGRPCAEQDDCCDSFFCVTSSDGLVCSSPSDRNLKTNFGSVDPADMLARVRELPISTWAYTVDATASRGHHIGPMAQGFAAIFGVGGNDRRIHPLDGQGVALAAIQGLAARLEALQTENAGLAARVAELERHP